MAAATSYDINVFLGHRDPVFDAFYGISGLPAPPPPGDPAASKLYDFRIFLNQRDPVFDAFYSIPGPAPAVVPAPHPGCVDRHPGRTHTILALPARPRMPRAWRALLDPILVISATLPTYARADVAFERGEGAYLYDTNGRRYLDFAAGVAVVSLGHCHPHLVAALQHQAGTLWHTSNMYRIPLQEKLAQRLCDNSFADRAFFCNSGAEAVEAGLKMVRKYHDETGNPDRYRVITFAGAFHGRTLATISAGQQKKHLAGFEPAVDGFDQVPYGDLAATRAAITEQTAAILVEAIQGEGGARTAPPGFLKGLRALCDEFGLLLFLDEVQTGMGRTGRLFAYEWEGITPDVMSVAKGLGAGFRSVRAWLPKKPPSA